MQPNAIVPDTRSAGSREGNEPAPTQDTDNTTEADELAKCGILDTNELEKLASKDHVPADWAAVFRQASKDANKETLTGVR